MTSHPPLWQNANKRLVFEISSPPRSVHGGHLDYSRWAAMTLPPRLDPRAAVARLRHRAGFYDYAPSTASAVDWHVNFADPHLFGFYGGSLFAQDEIQVVEHPALGALREALAAGRMKALTVERDEPTPVLVMGVERRCRVATGPDSTEGRPHGLCGNEFAQAGESAIRRATTRIDPPTVTNLISMAAPRGGPGAYTHDEIEHVLVTAYTAFRAAAMESARTAGATGAGGDRAVIVHTGWWGCGAFGGNRELMAALQLLAAEMAGVEQLVFHSGSPADEGSLKGAVEALEDAARPAEEVAAAALIERLVAMRFTWGVGNGT